MPKELQQLLAPKYYILDTKEKLRPIYLVDNLIPIAYIDLSSTKLTMNEYQDTIPEDLQNMVVAWKSMFKQN